MDTLSTDMNSMLNSVSSWWGTENKPPQDTPINKQTNENADVSPPQPAQNTEETPSVPDGNSEADQKDTVDLNAKSEEQSADIDIEEMSAKAVTTAKEWGSYLYSFGKSATLQVTDQVSKTAKQFKDTIDDKTMIGDFNKIQTQFVSENQEKKKKSEAAVAPWVGYNEEEAMKSQILALSSDKRNFLRNPPAGVQFHFDFEASFPVAMAMLLEDPNLKKMRFDLVPKQVKEERFWRNYFYRVSLIRQSAQLTSLAQHTGSSDSPSRPGSAKGEDLSRDSGSASHSGASSIKGEREAEDFTASSPADHEFVSDTFQESQITENDIKKEMLQLGMSDKEEDIPEWEKELQAELQEYEVVNDGLDDDDDDLEQEILEQLEAESNEEGKEP